MNRNIPINKTYKVASWNVNSLSVRINHVLQWLDSSTCDVLFLQELKLENHKFPLAEITAAGYHSCYIGQKTYNGVAILSKYPIHSIEYNLPNFPDEQKRVISATINIEQKEIRLINVYVPNGQALDSDKFIYKLNWLAALKEYLANQLTIYPNLILGGDFNITPEDKDVHDPELWRDKILCSPTERKALQQILALGLEDSFRLLVNDDKLFSWWDYRMMGFRRNHGLRIDLLLTSIALNKHISQVGIDKSPRKLERPSDHTPVWLDLKLSN